MDLSPREATDLARFIARRFPQRAELDRIARRARIELDDTLAGSMEAVWSTVIVEASVQRRLRSLARVIARDDAADPRMQEVCRLLIDMEPVPASTRLLRGVAVAATVALVVGLAAWGLGGQQVEPAALPQQPVAVEAATVGAAPVEAATVEAATVEAAPVEAATVEAASVEAAPVEAAPVEPATDQDPAEPVATDAPKTASIVGASPAATRTGCTGAPGQIVGYWYAGETSPGRAGDTITVREAVNVRADYPDHHNNYDARSDLRCTLAVGDRVRLSKAPILVPGDRWWVPLSAGDLVGG